MSERGDRRREVLDEQVRMLRLRCRVDLTLYRLGWSTLSRKEAQALIEQTREEILELFPDKGEVFELVLRPRFLRVLNERALAKWGAADSLN